MELRLLQTQLRTLAALEETDAPVISCYLNLAAEADPYRQALDERVHVLRMGMPGKARAHFEEALAAIEMYLGTRLLAASRGAALFSRAGAQPFFLPMQFQVVLPHSVSVGCTPNIYHLVELKDTYHRYVLLLCKHDNARILEVNLGAITAELLLKRPELRQRALREWGKDYYRSSHQELSQFASQQIGLIDQLMAAQGHTHLIVAGDAKVVALVTKLLPGHLRAKLVDTVSAKQGARTEDLVAAALASFVEQEEQESRLWVERLQQCVMKDGLGVVGAEASLGALQQRQVDVLVLSKDYDLGTGWRCEGCARTLLVLGRPQGCIYCGERAFREVNLREEMVRLAELTGARVEVVEQSEVLSRMEGVGCLLRFRASNVRRSFVYTQVQGWQSSLSTIL
jgi:Bacterial archaeo-eukaryotic release factor family 10